MVGLAQDIEDRLPRQRGALGLLLSIGVPVDFLSRNGLPLC